MSRITTKVVGFGMAVILAALSFAVACGKTAEEVKVVKIGWVGAFTGAASATYDAWLVGTQVYLNYINDEDPIPGVKLEFDLYDTRYDPSREVLAYYKMEEDGVLAINTVASAFQVTAKPLAEEDKIPIIAGATGKDSVEPPGWIFGVNVPQPQCARIGLQFIHENWDYEGEGRNPKLAVFGWNMPFGLDHIRACEAFAADFDIDLVLTEMTPVGTMDMSVNGQRGISSGADWFMEALLPGPLASVLREVYTTAPGQVESLCFYSRWSELLEAVGAAGEGLYISNYNCDFQEPTPAGVSFMAGLMDKAYPGGWEAYNDPTVLMQVPAIMFLVKAIRTIVAEDGVEGLNGEKLYEVMQTIELDTEGIYHDPIYYGSDNRVGAAGTYIWQIQNGEVIRLPGWWNVPLEWYPG
jgi:ABC-type branched-subunit amino acid transport system substrate-binding protein